MQMHLGWCEALFLHPLAAMSAAALEVVGPNTVVVWCGMGADFYAYAPAFRDHLVLPRTKQTQRAVKLRRALTSLSGVRSVIRLRSRWFLRQEDPVARVASRVDLFCARESGLALEAALPGFRARQVDNFGYYALERALTQGADPVEGSDILIGNSATWSNNHFDLFEQIRGLDLDGRRIVLPLNYGHTGCADAVERRARSLFGNDRILALRDWMPVADYNRLLARCGTVFMNHTRGQAMGNISSMLIRGARVHLRPGNPYSEFFENLGARIGRIGSGRLDSGVLVPLTPEDRARNAAIMREYWAWPAVTKRTAGLFGIVSQELERKGKVKPPGQDSARLPESADLKMWASRD